MNSLLLTQSECASYFSFNASEVKNQLLTPTQNVSKCLGMTQQSTISLVRLQTPQTNPTDATFKFNSFWFVLIWCEVQLALHRNFFQMDTFLLFIHKYFSYPVLYVYFYFYQSFFDTRICTLLLPPLDIHWKNRHHAKVKWRKTRTDRSYTPSHHPLFCYEQASTSLHVAFQLVEKWEQLQQEQRKHSTVLKTLSPSILSKFSK